MTPKEHVLAATEIVEQAVEDGKPAKAVAGLEDAVEALLDALRWAKSFAA